MEVPVGEGLIVTNKNKDFREVSECRPLLSFTRGPGQGTDQHPPGWFRRIASEARLDPARGLENRPGDSVLSVGAAA